MSSEAQLTWEGFLFLAQEAGLDPNSPHMEELYPYVQSVLADMAPLRAMDVSDTEPDMAFVPNPEHPQ